MSKTGNPKAKRMSFSGEIQKANKIRSMSSDPLMQFVITYICCEVLCKKIISAIEGTKPIDIKLDMRKIPSCHNKYGVIVDKEVLSAIFGSERTPRSCRVLRNDIFHSLKVDSVKEVGDHSNKYIGLMDTYINAVRVCT